MTPKVILLKWEEYFNNQNLTDLLNLYHPQSSLLPTFSKEILLNHNDIKKYLFLVIKKQNGSVDILNDSIIEQKIEDNVHLIIGKYIFYLNRGREHPARFSFILDLSLEQPIKHHHSSKIIKN